MKYGWIMYVSQVCLLCFSQLMVAQNHDLSKQTKRELIRDKQDYMNTFKKEQQKLNSRSEPDKRVLDTRPAMIPEDILSMNEGTMNQKNVLGISNPCLDSSKAFKMAKVRALAIAGLTKKCSVQYISDFYSNEDREQNYNANRNTWEEYGNIQATINWDPQTLQVLDSHYTNYDEGLVKLRLPESNSLKQNKLPNSMKIKVDVYHIRNKVGEHQSDKWRYDLRLSVNEGTSTKLTSQYTLTHTPNGQKSISTWQGKKDSLCKAYFLYKTRSQQIDTANLNINYTLDYGIWSAYMKGIVNKIILKSQKRAEKIKTLKQDYDRDYEDLSRAVAKDHFRLQFNHLTISNNRLQTQINVNKPNTSN